MVADPQESVSGRVWIVGDLAQGLLPEQNQWREERYARVHRRAACRAGPGRAGHAGRPRPRAGSREHRHQPARAAAGRRRPRGPDRAVRDDRALQPVRLQRPVLGLQQRRLVRGRRLQRPLDRRRPPVRATSDPARTGALLSHPRPDTGSSGGASGPRAGTRSGAANGPRSGNGARRSTTARTGVEVAATGEAGRLSTRPRSA
jgi:hypothetical protein